MTTRRRFLGTSLLGVAGCALVPDSLRARRSSFVADALETGPAAPPEARDFWNDWPAYIKAEMNAARAKRLAKLAEVDTVEKAHQRAAMIRETLWSILGGQPEKTPVNARVTHRRDRGYCRIETLIFESLPGVFVTANLYVPARGSAPFPAILAPVGHSSNGKAYASYQHFFQSLARQGFVVLTYDPWGQGERFQYLDSTSTRSRFEPTGEHSQAGRPMVLMGQGVARYLAWDGIRALDYLLTRDEVDAHRIGCAGHSGGGTMTCYLAALEPRIQVAVTIEGNTENLAGPAFDPPGPVDDAEQNIVNSLLHGLDRADLLYAFAPRPLLICFTTHDVGETYSPALLQDTRDFYAELENVYGVFGKKDHLSLFTGRLPHDLGYFNRRAAQQWLNRWLRNDETPAKEVALDVFPEADLNATETGQVVTTPGCRTALQVNAESLRQLLPKSPFLAGGPGLDAAGEALRRDLLPLLAMPGEGPRVDATIVSRQIRNGVAIEEVQLRSHPAIRLPGWLSKMADGRERRPAILLVADDGGEDTVNDPGSMDRLTTGGHTVFAVTLRGLGIASPRMPASAPNYFGDSDRINDGLAWDSLALGIPAIGQRVFDIGCALDYLASRSDVDPEQIRVLGRGDAGIAALLAVSLDRRVRSLLLDGTLLSYASIVESADYSVRIGWYVPGILRRLDLPDVTASIAPRPCCLVNCSDANGKALTRDETLSAYRDRIGERAMQHIRVAANPAPDREETYLWWVGVR